MLNDFLARYEQDLIDKNTKEVTEKVTKEVTKEVTKNVLKTVAKSLKNVLSDNEIAKHTGLTLKEVQNL